MKLAKEKPIRKLRKYNTMRKLLVSISILLCLFIVNNIYGQRDRMSLGPRIGMNIASANNPEGVSSRSGLLLGLTSTYSINESSGLTVDLLYSGEGLQFGTQDLKSAYVRLPILYNVFFGELGEKLRPKVYAGFTPGFLVMAKLNDVNVKENVNGFAFGLEGGLGLNYRLGRLIWLNADLRSHWGLTNISDDISLQQEKIAGRNLSFSVGVAFGLSKLD